jgi:hypothetical protein
MDTTTPAPSGLGPGCGPHCVYQYGKAHHCPCSATCHGAESAEQVLADVEELLAGLRPTPDRAGA